MSNLMFIVNIHADMKGVDQLKLREIVEESLNVCMSELEKHTPIYIGYKIRETLDLEE